MIGRDIIQTNRITETGHDIIMITSRLIKIRSRPNYKLVAM